MRWRGLGLVVALAIVAPTPVGAAPQRAKTTSVKVKAKTKAKVKRKKRARARHATPTPIPAARVEDSVPPEAVPTAPPTVPPAAVLVDDSTRPQVVAHAAATPPRAVDPRRLEVRVQDGVLVRRLRYVDDLPQDGRSVRAYDLTANAATVYLFARPFAGFELVAGGELVTGEPVSHGPDGTSFHTHAAEGVLGARYVLALGPTRTALELGGGVQRFVIDDEMSPYGELVPDTSYRFVRAGARTQLRIAARISIEAAFGWRQLVGTGELASSAWFPRITGDGVDGRIAIDIRFAKDLRGYLAGEVRRYFFAINPEVGDALIVGGAVDQYASAAAGLAFEIH
jgi:hypothetical protein